MIRNLPHLDAAQRAIQIRRKRSLSRQTLAPRLDRSSLHLFDFRLLRVHQITVSSVPVNPEDPD